jgi:hypothetical protein
MNEKNIPTFEQLVDFAKLFDISGTAFQNKTRMEFLKMCYESFVVPEYESEKDLGVRLTGLVKGFLTTNLILETWQKDLPKLLATEGVERTPIDSMGGVLANSENIWAGSDKNWFIRELIASRPAIKCATPNAYDLMAKIELDLAMKDYFGIEPLNNVSFVEEINAKKAEKKAKKMKAKNKPWYTSFSGKAGKPPRY